MANHEELGMPQVELPPGSSLNDKRELIFTIETDQGPVRVRGLRDHFECRGRAGALIAAGISRPEWFPGYPGNQKSRQMIGFESGGPRVLLEGVKGRKLTAPHIAVSCAPPHSYVVELPATPEQCRRLEVFHDEWFAWLCGRTAPPAARYFKVDNVIYLTGRPSA